MSVRILPEIGMWVGGLREKICPQVGGQQPRQNKKAEEGEFYFFLSQRWEVLPLPLDIRTPDFLAFGLGTCHQQSVGLLGLWLQTENCTISFLGSEALGLGLSQLPAFLVLQLASSLSWDFSTSMITLAHSPTKLIFICISCRFCFSGEPLLKPWNNLSRENNFTLLVWGWCCKMVPTPAICFYFDITRGMKHDESTSILNQVMAVL